MENYLDVSQIPRSTWDEAHMSVAIMYALRSPDPSTKHGCVIVDENNIPLGFGYNGFPKGSKDNSRYPTTRPEKYKTLPHSELNALLNRTLNSPGGIVYVTGQPCSGCMVAMNQGGVKKVIYGKIGSHCVDDSDWAITKMVAENCGIELIPYQGAYPGVVFSRGQCYLDLKGWSYAQES